jgi:hypothetical protein
MRRWLPRLALAALPLAATGCGGGTVIISFNSGVVVGQPACHGGGGRFDLRDSGGLVIVVVITSGTTILVSSGGTGTCHDLFPDAPVDVRGRDSGGEILATEITLR